MAQNFLRAYGAALVIWHQISYEFIQDGITCYYPPQLDDRTGDMDPELFHIEFDDGDEMDMNSAELHHAIQLAQERGYASAAEDGEEGDGAMGIA